MILYVQENGNLVTGWTAGTGMTQTYQFIYTNDDTYAPLDNSAVITITNADGTEATGVVMTKWRV